MRNKAHSNNCITGSRNAAWESKVRLGLQPDYPVWIFILVLAVKTLQSHFLRHKNTPWAETCMLITCLVYYPPALNAPSPECVLAFGLEMVNSLFSLRHSSPVLRNHICLFKHRCTWLEMLLTPDTSQWEFLCCGKLDFAVICWTPQSLMWKNNPLQMPQQSKALVRHGIQNTAGLSFL